MNSGYFEILFLQFRVSLWFLIRLTEIEEPLDQRPRFAPLLLEGISKTMFVGVASEKKSQHKQEKRIVEARKLEHHYPHALKVKYKGS